VLLAELETRRAAFVAELDRFNTEAAFERPYGIEAKALDAENFFLYLAEKELLNDPNFQKDFLLHLLRDNRAISSDRIVGGTLLGAASAEDGDGESLEHNALPDRVSALQALYLSKFEMFSLRGGGCEVTQARYRTSLLYAQYCLKVLELHGEWFRSEVEGR
jgi:hypothetical protein